MKWPWKKQIVVHTDNCDHKAHSSIKYELDEIKVRQAEDRVRLDNLEKELEVITRWRSSTT